MSYPPEGSQAPELFLISPLITDASAFAPLLVAACEAAPLAAILLPLALDDLDRYLKNTHDLKELVVIGQKAGSAVLLTCEPTTNAHVPSETFSALLKLVRQTGAEGLHMSGDLTTLKGIRKACGTELTLGAGQLKARHDAMEAGEGGADYLLFGEPDIHGQCPAFSGVVERAGWWSNLFAIPCVAYAPQLSDIPALKATTCEFIALGDAVWNHAEGPRVALQTAHALCSKQVEEPTS
jgi:thiamine-phosphate pyrophosphorylase